MPFGKRKNVTADKVAVAQLLAARGPLPGADATSLLGWTADRWWNLVGGSNDWFALTGKGWMLTDVGWAAVEPAAV